MSNLETCSSGHDMAEWRGREICLDCGFTETPGLSEPPLEHDHKCPSRSKDISSAVTCTYCQIIRSVRAEYVQWE